MTPQRQRETIAAIATASGQGGVGIVRVSGENAAILASSLLGKPPTARHAHFAHFCDTDQREIDHGLLLFFKGPQSYTGEDVLELQIHGSPFALKRLLSRCVELGARLARPGEFTERAYLNQKLDLAQAEAVADLIAAQSEAAAIAAVRSLDGEFSKLVRAQVQQLTELRVYVEAMIDFPDEEVDFVHDQALLKRLDSVQNGLAGLLKKTEQGQRLRDGLHIVIIGPPNAGKSALLNAFAQADRAIVTPIAGTTRDVLREHITLNGVPVTLVDTAGLRESADVVEAEGIRRAKEELQKADLALILLGSDQPEPSFESLEAELPEALKRLRVRSKADLDSTIGEMSGFLAVSSRTGSGLPELQEEILKVCGLSSGQSGSFSARMRHVQALQNAQQHQQAAQAWLQQSMGDLAAEELRLAQVSLSSITGDFSADDLLGQIFSSFCIGK
jgi:tRNA modification GTPase